MTDFWQGFLYGFVGLPAALFVLFVLYVGLVTLIDSRRM